MIGSRSFSDHAISMNNSSRRPRIMRRVSAAVTVVMIGASLALVATNFTNAASAGKPAPQIAAAQTK